MVSGLPGECVADPQAALRNPLNAMSHSLAQPENLREFRRDEQAYCLRFGLNRQQRDAVRRRDFVAMIDAGGQLLYLDRLASALGLDTLESILRHQGR
jgi:protocatechuate 4,5-dioxygenase, alpha chain